MQMEKHINKFTDPEQAWLKNEQMDRREMDFINFNHNHDS